MPLTLRSRSWLLPLLLAVAWLTEPAFVSPSHAAGSDGGSATAAAAPQQPPFDRAAVPSLRSTQTVHATTAHAGTLALESIGLSSQPTTTDTGADNPAPSSPPRSFASRPLPAAVAANAGRSFDATPPLPIQSPIRRCHPPRKPHELPRPEDNWLWPRHQLRSAGDPCARLHSESGCRGAPRDWHCKWMRTIGSKRGLSCMRFKAHLAEWNAIERMLRRSMPNEPRAGTAAASDATDRDQSAFGVMSAAASADQTELAQFIAEDVPTRTNKHKRPKKQAEGTSPSLPRNVRSRLMRLHSLRSLYTSLQSRSRSGQSSVEMLRQAMGVRAALLQQYHSLSSEQQERTRSALERLIGELDNVIDKLQSRLAQKELQHDERLHRLRNAESLAADITQRVANGTHSPDDAKQLRDAHASLMADFFSFPLRLQEWLEQRYRRAIGEIERASSALADAPRPEPKTKPKEEQGNEKDKPSDSVPPRVRDPADSPPADEWPEARQPRDPAAEPSQPPPPLAESHPPSERKLIRCTPICDGQSCRISCPDK